MSSPLRLFWWAPTRSLRLGWPEVRQGGPTWLRVAKAGGIPGRNFGDELSPLVVALASGRRVRWAPPGRADLVAIGSVMELQLQANSSCAVWGTGLRGAWPTSWERPSEQQVLAVRGELTRRELGLSCPVGDPGVLIAQLTSTARVTRQGTVVLPHFRVWSSKQGRARLRELAASGSRVVSPALAPLEVAEQLRRSDLVLTSSLHGLITCHALGIPAIRVSFGEAVSEDSEFKYRDHETSLAVSVPHLEIEHVLRLGVPEESRQRACGIAEISATRCADLGTSLVRVLADFAGGS